MPAACLLACVLGTPAAPAPPPRPTPPPPAVAPGRWVVWWNGSPWPTDLRPDGTFWMTAPAGGGGWYGRWNWTPRGRVFYLSWIAPDGERWEWHVWRLDDRLAHPGGPPEADAPLPALRLAPAP